MSRTYYYGRQSNTRAVKDGKLPRWFYTHDMCKRDPISDVDKDRKEYYANYYRSSVITKKQEKRMQELEEYDADDEAFETRELRLTALDMVFDMINDNPYLKHLVSADELKQCRREIYDDIIWDWIYN